MGPGTYEGKEKMVYLPWMSLGTFSELSEYFSFAFKATLSHNRAKPE